MKILIFEMDFSRGDELFQSLRRDNVSIHWVDAPQEAQKALGDQAMDLLILDLSSLESSTSRRLDFVCALRNVSPSTPVLIITEHQHELDILADCAEVVELSTHLTTEQLRQLSLKLLGQRCDGVSRMVSAGDLRIDLRLRKAFINSRPISLTSREYAVLRVLAAKAGQVVARRELMDRTYHWAEEIESNALEVHVSNLRKKLGKERILTCRGVGYRLLKEYS